MLKICYICTLEAVSGIKDKRIRIICGHYGSGKSEFSVNYAIKLNESHSKVALVDLDVVNPYFRSREQTEEMESLGIKVISSSLKGNNADLPSISGEVNVPIIDSSYELVIDLGGDNVGARVLGRYREDILNNEYDMLIVLNANRPETQTKEQSIKYVKDIEATSGLKVSGIINNTHLLKSTTIEDVLRGQKLAEQVAEELNIDVRYTAAIETLENEIPENLKSKYFPIGLYLRKDWMS